MMHQRTLTTPPPSGLHMNMMHSVRAQPNASLISPPRTPGSSAKTEYVNEHDHGHQQQQYQLDPSGPASNKKSSLYKTELCRSWEETGQCRYGNKCQFAHSLNELRQIDRHPKYKTEMCKTFWDKGTCPYGKRCCFIHNEKDKIAEYQAAQAKAQQASQQQHQQQESPPQTSPVRQPLTQIQPPVMQMQQAMPFPRVSPVLQHLRHCSAEDEYLNYRRSASPFSTASSIAAEQMGSSSPSASPPGESQPLPSLAMDTLFSRRSTSLSFSLMSPLDNMKNDLSDALPIIPGASPFDDMAGTHHLGYAPNSPGSKSIPPPGMGNRPRQHSLLSSSPQPAFAAPTIGGNGSVRVISPPLLSVSPFERRMNADNLLHPYDDNVSIHSSNTGNHIDPFGHVTADDSVISKSWSNQVNNSFLQTRAPRARTLTEGSYGLQMQRQQHPRFNGHHALHGYLDSLDENTGF